MSLVGMGCRLAGSVTRVWRLACLGVCVFGVGGGGRASRSVRGGLPGGLDQFGSLNP